MTLHRHALSLFALWQVVNVAAQQEKERAKSMKDFQDKASEFKNQFMSLTSDALELQCKQLEAAKASGQADWLDKKGPDGTSSISDHLAKLCAALKSRQSGTMKEVANGEKDWAKEQAKSIKDKANFYKASALGCTTLLKAQNNGKMEWFESEGWYKKTLDMCKSLSVRTPMEMEDSVKQKKGTLLSKLKDLEGDTPIELLKGTCSKLEHAPPAVREKPWFVKAQQMCSTVSGASHDDMRSMLMRLKTQAESGSGQLIKETCSKLSAANQQGELDRHAREPWYKTAVAMCSKIGGQELHASGLEQRCQWLENMKRSGKLDAYMRQPWYDHLAKACMWERLHEHHETPAGVPAVRSDGVPAVYV